MRIGLFSDLHLEHRNPREWPEILDSLRTQALEAKVDLIVNAGDTHHDLGVRLDVAEKFSDDFEYFSTQGNHDFYGNFFPDQENAIFTCEYLGTKILFSTMWTDFDGDPNAVANAVLWISDFRAIWGASADKMVTAFRETIKAINKEEPDVVVTHFGCSPGSIHPRWDGSNVNSYFCPDAVARTKHKPKLWLHGHIHDPTEYSVSGLVTPPKFTRVVANPMGYPNETYKHIKDYKLKVIEL